MIPRKSKSKTDIEKENIKALEPNRMKGSDLADTTHSVESFYGEIECEITGVGKGLIQSRLDLAVLKPNTDAQTMKVDDPEVMAKNATYMDIIDGKKQLYIPNKWIKQMMIKASKLYTVKRFSMSGLIAGCVEIVPEKIPLGTAHYEVLEEAVAIKKGGRILTGRPLIKKWTAAFSLKYDRRILGSEKAITLLFRTLEDGGIRLGIGAWRPEHHGEYGRFQVTKFKILS
jgi:hypothetical protein